MTLAPSAEPLLTILPLSAVAGILAATIIDTQIREFRDGRVTQWRTGRKSRFSYWIYVAALAAVGLAWFGTIISFVRPTIRHYYAFGY